MAAGQYSFTIEQGSAFSQTFQYQTEAGAPINITGAYIAMQCRPSYGSDTVNFSASTTGGNITITDAANGTFRIDFTSTETAAFTAGGVYDIEISPGGDTSATLRLLQGTITLSPEATLI
jgi:hypothetical protein